MKKTKKILSLLLAALLIVSTFSAALASDISDLTDYTIKDYGDCGNGVKWYFAQKDSQDTMVIVGTGAMSNYSQSSLPRWTELNEKIRRVEVKEGVTSVGDFAFKGCPNLTEVVLEKDVQNVGVSAFAECSNLRKVTFPEKLSGIGESAFEKCTALRAIDLPAGLKTLGRYAFFECKNLSSEVVIPKGVSLVPDSAFFRCYSIQSLVLQEGVTAIGNSAFSWCIGLKKIELPKSLRSLDKGAFAECPELTSITIPEKVSVIPESAFACVDTGSKLSEVTMYNTVNRIEDSAFFGCPISKVTFYGTSEDWQRVWIEGHNDSLKGADRLFIAPQGVVTPTKPAGTPTPACKYCGQPHGNSFGQKLTAFFHKILAFFGLKKKA